MIQYSGSARISTFLGATKQNIIDNVGAALLAAGWTTVTGGSGTTSWKLQSATTPQGYSMRVKIQDNGGTCATFSVESSDGVLVGGNSTTAGGGWLIPNSGYTYEVICCGYQAFIAVTPYSSANGPKTFVAFGVPYINLWDTGSVTRAAWCTSNGQSDADVTTERTSFRIALTSSAASPSMQGFFNANLHSGNGYMYPLAPIPPLTPTVVQTASGKYIDVDANLVIPTTTSTTLSLVYIGQLWDAFVTSAPTPADQTFSQSGHNWITLTNSWAAGTLCVATS